MNNKVKKHGEVISNEIRDSVSCRYRVITKAINTEFWDSSSSTAHSLYVGSYGRGTAIDTSDIDMLVEIPEYEYKRYDRMKGNGQSRLLQAVKESIKLSYPRTTIKADGQVVVLLFHDGIKFEVVPTFREENYLSSNYDKYIYPDTNNGGNWKATTPKAEKEAMRRKNDTSNGLLFDTCKHIRRLRDDKYSSYHLSGILIDSFVYHAIGTWKWSKFPDGTLAKLYDYEKSLLEYFNQHKYERLTAPGSDQYVSTKDYWVLEKILELMVS